MSASTSYRVDAHCHLWKLERGDYHWMDINDPAFETIARNFDIDDLNSAHKPAHIEKAVLVQAAATEGETEFLLSIAKENPQIAGVVGWVDLQSNKVFETLKRFSSFPLFKGIRPMLQDIENTDWLIEAPQKNVWKFLVENNLRFDALVKPRHLPMLLNFCLEHPQLPIVIDHVAKPNFTSLDQKELNDTYEAISNIGRTTHAFCKFSGLLTEMAPEQIDNAYEILKPLLDQLLSSFGPERIMWGSDWPVVRLAGGYQKWNELTDELLKDLDQTGTDAILSNTASQFYGLDGDE